MKKSFNYILGLLTAIFAVTNLHAVTYTVAGDAAIVNGTTAWDETNTDNDMTELGDGTYQLVITDCELTAGTTYEFKVVQDHDWNIANWPSSNWNVGSSQFSETAVYTLTYTFNPSTDYVDFTATKTRDIWTVAGSATNSSTGGAADALFGTSWDPTQAANDMSTNGNGIWTLTLRGKTLSAGTIAYKVANGRAWTAAYPASNATLTVPASGIYDVEFTFNSDSKTVYATLLSAKAIWCYSGKDLYLYLTYDENTYARGGTYKGNKIDNTKIINPYGHKSAGFDCGNNYVDKVVIEPNFLSFTPISMAKWFSNAGMTSISGIQNINTSNVTDMNGTFSDCTFLQTLDLSLWDTSNVTNFNNTFDGCYHLTTLNISGWDTSKVTSFNETFARCMKLPWLDVSNWDTSNVTGMYRMFWGCQCLTTLDVSNWDTSKVTNLRGTFEACSGLTTLDVSKWDTGNVTVMNKMFYGCNKLTSLDVSNWDTGNVTDMNSMFYECSSLTSLDVSNWDTGNVTNMGSTFYKCSNLTTLDVSKWDTGNVTDMNSTFLWCRSLTTLDVSKWDTSNVTDMGGTFGGCSGVTTLDVSKWDTSNVTDMGGTFGGCSGVTTLDVSNWETSNVTDMGGTFGGCSGVTTLDVSNWETSKVTEMGSMFYECDGLTKLDLSSWDTSNVTNMGSMFYECDGLTKLDLSSWDTDKVNSFGYMFYDCNELTSVTFGKKFSAESAYQNAIYWYWFDDPEYEKEDPESFFAFTFDSCPKLRYIDFFASDDTDAFRVLDIGITAQAMFDDVPQTTVIYLPHGCQEITNKQNFVYSYNGDENDLRCPLYYSEDKVDIEIPRPFKSNEAQYTRTMSKNYGSVILPYEFSSNEKIQAYTLDDEYTKQMFFKDAATVPAHTPFAFKKLSDDTTADFTMTDESQNFGITINATRSTHPDEISWDGQAGAPYTDAYGATESAVKLEGWTTKGYYVNQTFTPQDEGYSDLFYIASEKFYRANGETLTFPPHRVTFHGAWTKGVDGDAKTFDIVTEDDLPTLIEGIDADRNEYVNGEAEGIYDTAGRRLETLRKGVNIVRMNDGSVRKVFIK